MPTLYADASLIYSPSASRSEDHFTKTSSLTDVQLGTLVTKFTDQTTAQGQPRWIISL